jgi:hypothetical protein
VRVANHLPKLGAHLATVRARQHVHNLARKAAWRLEVRGRKRKVGARRNVRNSVWQFGTGNRKCRWHAPFTSQIRAILLQTKRCSPRKAFDAARQTMPFDRVNGDINVVGLLLFVLYVHQHAHAPFTTNAFVSRMELGPCL